MSVNDIVVIFELGEIFLKTRTNITLPLKTKFMSKRKEIYQLRLVVTVVCN